MSQNRNNIWCFGDSAGIDFSNVTNPTPIGTAVRSRGSCSNICDSTGNLLFYCFNKMDNDSSGYVYSYDDNTMQNGVFLNGQGEYDQMVIVPDPANINLYYIIYNGIYSTKGLYYSVVDINLNNGLGSVIQKNIPLISDTRIADCTKALRHGNGKDWWIITKYSSDVLTFFNRFYIYLITENGISGLDSLEFGNAADGDLQKLIFNNHGNKLMNINYGGLMTEYDFDRCTGIISNPNIIYQEQTSNFTRPFWDACYSPNDSILYVSTSRSSSMDTAYLLKYNLNSVIIPLSCDTLDIFTSPIGTGALRLAPDGKIYFSRAYEWGLPGFPYNDTIRNYINENLSVINYPDSLGAACDYQPFSFNLGGKRTYYGLPNNPNYELGPLIGSGCDTINNSVADLSFKNESKLFVFYHASWKKAFINAQCLSGRNYSLYVFDVGGKEVYQESGRMASTYFTKDLNCDGLANGIYIVSFLTERERLVKRFVKE